MDSKKRGYAAIVGFKIFYYCRRSVGKDTITYRCKAICQCGAVRAGWIDPESLEIADAALPGECHRCRIVTGVARPGHNVGQLDATDPAADRPTL